jgi:hypothetical protein
MVPRRAGAVRVGGRGFEIVDWPKLLTIWAVFRHLPRDTIWTARMAGTASDVEGEMVPEAAFTGPSAWKFARNLAMADYCHVLVYLPSDRLPDLKARMEPLTSKRGPTRLTVLRPDARLLVPVPPEQVYVDLWQLPDWWAAEFLRDMWEWLAWPNSTTTMPSRIVAGDHSSSYEHDTILS